MSWGTDAEHGRMMQGRFTLGAAGEVTTVPLGDGVRGVRIRPQGTAGDIVTFAISEDPEPEGDGAFAVGNYAVVGEAGEVRLPGVGSTDGSGRQREIRMVSTIANLEVLVETF
jgi:hypothetical protein